MGIHCKEANGVTIVRSNGITTTGIHGREATLQKHLDHLHEKLHLIDQANIQSALRKYGSQILSERLERNEGKIIAIRKSISICNKLLHPNQQKIA